MTSDSNKPTPEMQADLDAIDAALAGNATEAGLSDLGRLALELRAERPAPDPFFTRELDARAAAGFPRSRPRRRFALSPTLVPGVAASLLIVAVLGVTVLRGEDTDEFQGGGGGSAAVTESAPESDTAGQAEPQAAGDEAARAYPNASLPVPGPGGSVSSDARRRRVQETSASLTLTAPPARVSDVADGVVRVTDQLGGFVVTSSVSTTDGDGGGGLFELRVPSAKLQSALAELSKLAHVSQRQQGSQDITAEAVSARDRLADARAERTALLRRLARATTDAQIDSAKARLRAVSARITRAKADLARVNNRAAFSNIAVSLMADPNAGEPGTDDGQWTPADAARDALRVLEVAAGVLLIALALGLPLALLAALLAAAARLVARRRRERALDAI